MRAGGDPETLESVREQAVARTRAYLQGRRDSVWATLSDEEYEAEIRFVSQLVHMECANVALELQERINTRIRELKPDAHEITTARGAYCHNCGTRVMP